MKPAYLHILAIIIFTALAMITLRSFLFGDSLFTYRDEAWSEDYRIFSDALNTFNIDTTRRLLYLGPFFAFGSILNISSLGIEKIVFLFTRFVVGFFAYFAVYQFLQDKISGNKKNYIYFLSLFAGFFYAYNPFVTEKIGAVVYGFSFSYALIPILFYYYDKSLNSKGFVNIFVTALLWSLAVAGTIQFLTLLPLFLLMPWFIVTIIQRKKAKESILLSSKNAVMITALFILISFYWIFMAASLAVTGGNVRPAYILTDLMLDIFSKNTTVINGLRLMGTWWPYIELEPIIDESLWLVLTFMIPLSIISSVLLVRTPELRFYTLALFLIMLFVVFFFKGSQEPFPGFYLVLYTIPVVGWTFRVPDTNGLFLPFFAMMIITIGLYDLVTANRNRIISTLKFIPVLILLASVSLISWPMFTGDFGGIYDAQKVSFGNNIKQDNDFYVSEVIAVTGEADKVKTLEDLGILHANAPIIIADSEINTLSLYNKVIDKIIIDDKYNAIMQFLPENTVLVKPFDNTLKHNPSLVWSKASTADPLHGPFHMYIDQRGMQNTDYDYGKGLVITWGHDDIEIPFETKDGQSYDLFIRLLENPQGGKMKVHLDNYTIEINSYNPMTKFRWKSLGSLNLPNGPHTLKIENIGQFNAVNLFALVPTEEVDEMTNQAHDFLNKVQLINVLEGSQFENSESNASAIVDILKPAVYTFAIKLNACNECNYLGLKIGDAYNQVSRSSLEDSDWFYFTTYLTDGVKQITLYSDNAITIQTAIIYSDSHNMEPIDNLFAPVRSAMLKEWKQIDPTHYTISLNATDHFLLKFYGHPYNPSWTLHTGNGEYHSLPFCPDANCFIVQETGQLEAVLYFAQQKWFQIGAIVTIMTIASSAGFLLWQYKGTILQKSKTYRSRIVKLNSMYKSIIMVSSPSTMHRIIPKMMIGSAFVILIYSYVLFDGSLQANPLMVLGYFILVIGALADLIINFRSHGSSRREANT